MQRDWFADLTDSTVVKQEELEVEGKSTDKFNPVIEETNWLATFSRFCKEFSM